MQGTFISTATTTVVRSKKGKLVRLIVTGGTAGTIVIYDHASAASGTVIADFDSTNAINSYEFDRDVENGIVVVTGGATKITVISGNTIF